MKQRIASLKRSTRYTNFYLYKLKDRKKISKLIKSEMKRGDIVQSPGKSVEFQGHTLKTCAPPNWKVEKKWITVSLDTTYQH